MDVEISANEDIHDPAVRSLVGQKTGLVTKVRNGHLPRGSFPIVLTRAEYAGEQNVLGIGNKRSRDRSVIAAVAEVAERHCMINWWPDSPEGPCSYAEAPDHFGRFVEREYVNIYDRDALERADMEPLGPDEPIQWTTGHDLIANEPCRIPMEVVAGQQDDEATPHYWRSSNGMACGSTLSQAVANGLCELIERDALVRAWFTQTRPDRIDTSALPDVEAIRSSFEADEYALQLLRFPNDTSVATVGCVVTQSDDRLPQFALGMGTAIDVREACVDALLEVAQIRHHLQTAIADNRHVGDFDPDGLFSLEEGSVYYALARNVDAVDTLTEPDNTVTPEPEQATETDTEAVETLLSEMGELGCRVLCTDMTMPDVRQCGFHVVRLFAPELVPMTLPSLYPSRHPAFQGEAFGKYPLPFA